MVERIANGTAGAGPNDATSAGLVSRVSSLVSSDPGAAIEVTDLTVAYRDKPVLWDIDLTVPAGVLLAVVGPNGAGKSTLLKAILGLLRPVAGQVLIHGRPYLEQ